MGRIAASVAVILLAISVAPAPARQLMVVSSDVESGDAVPEWIGREIIEPLAAHVWGFSEVQSAEWAAAFEEAAEEAHRREYNFVLGTTWGADRLLVSGGRRAGLWSPATACGRVLHKEILRPRCLIFHDPSFS
jgi:hypothetical protein